MYTPVNLNYLLAENAFMSFLPRMGKPSSELKIYYCRKMNDYRRILRKDLVRMLKYILKL